MRFFRRCLYLAYYFRKMNWETLHRFMAFTRQQTRTPYWRQWLAIFSSSLKHNISPLEYYQFGFAKLSAAERDTWAGTGTMYEFQLKANPPESREVLRDKRKFYRAYRQFFRHQMYTLDELKSNSGLIIDLLSQHKCLVAKQSDGNCGKQVQFLQTSNFTPATLVQRLEHDGLDLVETFAVQHQELNRLSPTAVNTVRVFTILDSNNQCKLLGCRLRISINSPVDNLAAGNMAAPVDEATGTVCGPGVFSDITKPSCTVHPVTGVSVEGFQIPYWPETIALVRSAAELHPENRSIGWDIVITPDGPGLIEGNHDWCKLVWQLPVKRGLKPLLENWLI